MKKPDLLDEFLRESGLEDELELASAIALAAGVEEPPPALRARIMDAARSTHRFDEFEASVASILDLPIDAVRELLLAIDEGRLEEGGRWQDGPAPGVELLHLRGGPAVAGAITGFVRVAPGAEFPDHAHLGDETVLILQGAYRDSDGTIHRRGELVRMPLDTHHALVAIGEVPLVYLAVVRHGVRIGDVEIGPDDPRM
jgi:quercetin dioxygenase-like cupin family protein